MAQIAPSRLQGWQTRLLGLNTWGTQREFNSTAREEPRASRGRGAPFADFIACLDELARVRALAIWGLHELVESVEHEEARLGTPTEEASPGEQQSLQVAWERSQLAAAELAKGHPCVNAESLTGMCGVIDALVEDLLPAAEATARRIRVSEALAGLRDAHPDAFRDLDQPSAAALVEAIVEVAFDEVSSFGRVSGKGAKRYEDHLDNWGWPLRLDGRSLPTLTEHLRRPGHCATYSYTEVVALIRGW